MDSTINKALIFEHFAHKTTSLQRKLVGEWLKDEANEEKYYEWLEEWERSHAQYLPAEEEGLQQYLSFVSSNPVIDTSIFVEENIERMPSSNTWKTWAVAASALLMLSVVAYFFKEDLLQKKYQTTYGETLNLTLEDGSKVTLNTNSSLLVPRFGFGKSTREVFLTGEANFSILHTIDNQKFIVRTAKDLDVVVLGTEFTVSARQRGVQVVLKKGKVLLNYHENKVAKQLVMKPGDLATLTNAHTLAVKKTPQPENFAAWQEKRFVFEETTLEEVSLMLQENYGLQVEIKDETLAKRVIMGSFRAENVDELLQSISELLNINVVRQGNQVLLSDK